MAKKSREVELKRKREKDEMKFKEKDRIRNDLEQLFLKNTALNDILKNEPEGAFSQNLSIWKSMSRLTIDYIISKSNLDDLEVEAKDL